LHQIITGVDIVSNRVEMETVKEMKIKVQMEIKTEKVKIKEINRRWQ
jgi:hypothetical protein